MKPMIMTNKMAVDTNVLIYLHDDKEQFKQKIALDIMKEKPVISPQIISEYLNVLKRVLKSPKLELMEHCQKLIVISDLVTVNLKTITNARHLIQKYDFQLFDSIIVASALEAGCAVLYSEDLQHNQLVENQLHIINHFSKK